MVRIATAWTITPPPGLTPGGRVHTFQNRTVEKLRIVAEKRLTQAITRIQEEWPAAYPKGDGRIPGSLKMDVRATRTGVTAKLKIGQFRHLPYISILGGDYRSAPYLITPTEEKTLLRFRHSETGKMISVPRVIHPGFGGRDVLAAVLAEEGELFRLDAIDAVASSVLELSSPGSGQKASRRLRRR